ncbi:putative HAD-superfamily hydrolase [Candidatus Sulfopaludibacter sp. SbA4]|nr:putative HAD-superfamily hydrolase [Candidatus Sulfopaludibacter sp. SbA4]
MKPQGVKAAIFDCGGTLLEMQPSREAICASVLAGLGRTVPPEFIRRAYYTADFALPHQSSRHADPAERRRYYDQYNRCLSVLLGVESLSAEFNSAMQDAFGRGAAHWRLIEGTAEALATFHDRFGVRQFVLANWDRHLRLRLEENGILHWFEDVGDSQTLGTEKPDRAIFDAFLRRVNVEPREAIYVGNDYLADVVGSRRSGLFPMLLNRDGWYPSGCDCAVIGHLSELTQFL